MACSKFSHLLKRNKTWDTSEYENAHREQQSTQTADAELIDAR
ncbi:hypothetical protein HMPREF0183_0841 [Brevibacterium mcbrellneri ATCC 49030]|uniref:Uncharacterized protein n=1 Tax=Brevibacterium mcbrellneri ATCC 49030 TaxID=585530 RepID=D4YLN1_9MICO|nr:hypothetical protein HMPREF0183_0841 [Brevibacterium mcbrellneri ATCC 49030]